MRPAKKSWVHGFVLGAAALALAGLGLLRPSASPTSSAATPAPAVVAEAAPSWVPAPGAARDVASDPAVSTWTRAAGTSTASASVDALPAQDGEPYPAKAVDRATIVKLHGNLPLTTTHPDVQPVIEVKDRHAAELMARPGVVGAGVGLDGEGRVAVVVMTKAEVAGLPGELEGHPVLVWRTGPIASRQDVDAQGKGANGSGGSTTDTKLYQTRLERPVPIGVSTGLPSSYTYRDVKRGKTTFRQTYITAGTLGCRVLVGGVPHALSNFHVYSFDGVATAGANVLQPGTLDGGKDDANCLLGTLAAWIKPDPSSTENEVDAAIAAATGVGKTSLPNAAGHVVAPTTATAVAVLSAGVEKFGRTTGYTSGSVVIVSANVSVDYGTGMGVVTFKNQIGITDGTFSAGGDSGSLIVNIDGQAPVGLLFAGGSTSTFANPIDAVLGALGATIDGN